ncbi:MAG: hypothetical protein ACFFF9_15310 [Candidatus Thorarchaeota archaeon]
MTANEQSMDNYSSSDRLLSRNNIKAYLLTLFGFAIIIALYYLLAGQTVGMGPPGGQQAGRQPPGGLPVGGLPIGGLPGQSPITGTGLMTMGTWPLWGTLVLPSLLELAIGIGILVAFGLTIGYVYRKRGSRPSIFLIVIVGILLIIATNLIHGWQTGIEQTIGAASEIFSDAVNVNSFVDFIANFEALQPTLSLHAQTQPPGAVLAIYFLYLIFSDPSLIAIGLSIIAGIGSAFFLRGIVKRLFDEDSARYAVFLYLILPAVQVYYLANIYALVATLVLGVLYFYLHPDRRISAVGTAVSLFLLTFITFLSAFMILFLFIYEMLNANSETKTSGTIQRVRAIIQSVKYPLFLSLVVVAVYGVLYATLGFNYLNAFFYASYLENPSGFMLLANPAQYIATRAQNVMDIVIFFGPVLSVLAFKGLGMLRENAAEDLDSSKKYNLVLAALIALGLLFLAGAPKKGETARICMFFLPFLLIPVITYIRKTRMSNRDKAVLLLIVFGQAVLLQLIGFWLW